VFSIKYGGTKEFDAVFKLYCESNIAGQKLTALPALGYDIDPTLIQHALDLTLLLDMHAQDAVYLFCLLVVNTTARRCIVRVCTSMANLPRSTRKIRPFFPASLSVLTLNLLLLKMLSKLKHSLLFLIVEMLNKWFSKV
jgi:hypothetical protein